MSTATTIILGFGSFLTTYAITEITSLGEWKSLIISLISALIYAAINIGGKILLSVLKKKGKISEEDYEEISGNLDDLGDDGKLNGSVKKTKKKKSEKKEKKENEKNEQN